MLRILLIVALIVAAAWFGIGKKILPKGSQAVEKARTERLQEAERLE